MDKQLEFERCLDKRWLVRMPEARYLMTKELAVSCNDLAEAQSSFDRKSYKWSTIQSYYAMFHAARALLYSRGYREKSHDCLSVAMRYLFVSQGVLDEALIDERDESRVLREDADYRDTFSEMGASHCLGVAQRMLSRASELLSDWEDPQ